MIRVFSVTRFFAVLTKTVMAPSLLLKAQNWCFYYYFLIKGVYHCGSVSVKGLRGFFLTFTGCFLLGIAILALRVVLSPVGADFYHSAN